MLGLVGEGEAQPEQRRPPARAVGRCGAREAGVPVPREPGRESIAEVHRREEHAQALPPPGHAAVELIILWRRPRAALES